MEAAAESLEREVVVRNRLGLHSRPATLIAAAVARHASEVRLRLVAAPAGSDAIVGDTADARSILDLLTLNAACGARLAIEASGPDADAVTLELVDLFDSAFGLE